MAKENLEETINYLKENGYDTLADELNDVLNENFHNEFIEEDEEVEEPGLSYWHKIKDYKFVEDGMTVEAHHDDTWYSLRVGHKKDGFDSSVDVVFYNEYEDEEEPDFVNEGLKYFITSEFEHFAYACYHELDRDEIESFVEQFKNSYDKIIEGIRKKLKE